MPEDAFDFSLLSFYAIIHSTNDNEYFLRQLGEQLGDELGDVVSEVDLRPRRLNENFDCMFQPIFRKIFFKAPLHSSRCYPQLIRWAKRLALSNNKKKRLAGV